MDVMEKATNDKRLIDANAFLKDILTAGIGKTIIEYSESDIGYMIRKRPTVDAVEVVRCRECKKKNKKKCPMVIVNFGRNGKEILVQNHVPDDFYCAAGERK